MAWRISHTDEDWQNAEKNLRSWHRDTLIAALADDAYEMAHEATCRADAGDLAAEAMREAAMGMPHRELVALAMASIRRHMICSPGGKEFWLDREGYHRVAITNGNGGVARVAR